MHKYIIKIRSQILVYLTHNMALPFLKFVRRPLMFPYNKETLMNMDEGTLGNDLHRFLEAKKLDLLPYYAKHDIKHILLGYDTTDVLYGFVTMPEYWKKFIVAYKRGAKSTPLHNWQWFNIITEQTLVLQQKINNR
jgi:hypothetical protein